MEHPSESTLKRFASGTATREEGKAVVAHLLKGCSDCSRKLKSLIEPVPVAGRSYDVALEGFDRGLVEAMAASRHPMETLRDLLRDIPLPWPDEQGNGEE